MVIVNREPKAPNSHTLGGELSKIFMDLSRKAESAPPKFDPQRHKDETRSTIAKMFTKYFLGLVSFVVVGIPLYNLAAGPEQAMSIKDTLLAISSVVGGPFGFVVGYYFKGIDKCD